MPAMTETMKDLVIYFGDNLSVMRQWPDAMVDLMYIDPPFNTGKIQKRTQIATIRADDGDRQGFQGRRYRTIRIGTKAFADVFDDYLEFLEPRLREAYRLLKPDGSFFIHLDYREVHYVKVLLDTIFGRSSFMNEIIWAYDYGARSRHHWPTKHDNLLWYAKNPKRYHFDLDACDRIPYLAPGLVGPEKAARGEDTHGCLVAYDRESDGEGKNGLPDTETTWDPRSDRQGSFPPWGSAYGCLCREWVLRGGRARAWTSVYPRRSEP